ncbi:unnamed protein product [Blepharisma stoltei]|uniref:Dickkopf N-terminal cysteine-rich domain-containing protein n=1 Tax=Blepharisma stoltei TaxID=1481888 RepID=A0AAU9JYQ9_9CILI|nr:unnamed protein product [Blepharisma stoltei]
MNQSALALLLLASSVLAMETSSCSKISCSGSETTSSGKCVTVSGSTVSLSPCPDGYHCQELDQFSSSDEHSEATCKSDSTEPSESCPTSHDGDIATNFYCCVNADCASNKCDTANNKCIGIAEDGACTENEHCEAGFYCSSSKCTETVGEGKTCSYDYQCDAGYGCFGSFCLQYFSLKDNTITTNAKFCKSGLMYNSVCDSVTISSGGTVLSEPWECTIGQTCSYKYTHGNYQYRSDKDCECAGEGTTSTKGYCPIRNIMGIVDFTDDFYEKFQYDSSDCSGNYAHLTDIEDDLDLLVYCDSIDQDGKDYYDNMDMIVGAWSLYSSGVIDSCANDMGIFDPSEDIDSWDSAEFLALSGLLILFN